MRSSAPLVHHPDVQLRVMRWWDAPTGAVSPFLVLTGHALAEKRWTVDGLLDTLTAAPDEDEPPATAPPRPLWVRIRHDGAVEGVRTLLDELVRLGDEAGPTALPAGPEGSPERGAGAGGGRTRHAGPTDGAPDGRIPRPDRLIVIDDDACLERHHPKIAGALEKNLTAPAALDGAGLRVLWGRVEPHDTADSVDVPYVQPRDALLRRITAWAADPRSGPVLAVCGRPGSGKTGLLTDATRELSRSGDVVMGFTHLQGPGAGRKLSIEVMLTSVARILLESGVDIARYLRQNPITGILSANEIAGTATAVSISRLTIGHALTTADLVDWLEERRATDPGGAPLLIVLDNLEELGPDAGPEIDGLLADQYRLQNLNVRLLLSAYERPPLVHESETVQVDDATADIVAFARARLAHRGESPERQERSAARIAELSGGLFIVAAGLLAELDDNAPHEWLDVLKPVHSAGDYFVEALERLGTRRVDTERFLRILAIARNGMTLPEMARVWRAAAPAAGVGVAPGASWEHMSTTMSRGPLGRFVHQPGHRSSGRYVLLHRTLREALLRHPTTDDAPGRKVLVPADEGLALRAERLRFLAGLTPLLDPGGVEESVAEGTPGRVAEGGTGGGTEGVAGRAPGGVAWNAETGRLALAEAPHVLLDLIVQTLEDVAPDEERAAEYRRLVKRLLTDWEWLESCVRHRQEADDIPLGVATVTDTLDRVVALRVFDPDALVLTFEEPDPNVEEPGAGASPAVAGQAKPVLVQKKPPQGSKPRYLSAQSPMAREVLTGKARWPQERQARVRLERLLAGVSRAVNIPGSGDPERPVVWISGFATSTEESERGYRGQYAQLSVRQLPDGWWTVHAEKIPIDLRRHPSRGITKAPHPNWGHPALRKVANHPYLPDQDPRTYGSLEEANAVLDRLKEEYPETTILNDGLLFIMVFDRNRTPPIFRIRLEIRLTDDGRYVIYARPNEKPNEPAEASA